MRLLLASVFSLFLIGTTAADQIDKLVADLSSNGGPWMNGLSPSLDLPKGASARQVVTRFVDQVSFGSGGSMKRFAIIKHRKVRIAGVPPLFAIIKQRWVSIPGLLPDIFIAVLVRTNLGPQIVLLQYQGSSAGWWSKMFDAPPA